MIERDEEGEREKREAKREIWQKGRKVREKKTERGRKRVRENERYTW